MGLFSKPTKAEEVAALLVRTANNQADAIERQYVANYERLWNNPEVDPKDVIEALGNKAAELFVVTNQTMTIAGKGESLKAIPDRYDYQINQDGTITLTDKESGE